MTEGEQLALLREARSGDAEALGRLLSSYLAYLRILAMRSLDQRLQARVDPSDVVQQTCLEIHQDLTGFQGETLGEWIAWVRRILEHNLAEQVRRHVVTGKRAVDRESSLDDSGLAGPLRGRFPAEQSTPSQRAMNTEASVRLAQWLERLPDAQREAIRLRYLEGWSLSQMADRLGRSETATAGLLKRGLRTLRNLAGDTLRRSAPDG